MTDLKLIKKLKSYGFVLSPANYAPQDRTKDKKPKTKKGSDGKYHWSEDCSDEELVNAERIGIFHEPSSTYDIDFDDKSFVAHQFHSLLPDTFSIEKNIKVRQYLHIKLMQNQMEQTLRGGLILKKFLMVQEKLLNV